MNTGFWRSFLMSHGVLGKRLGRTQLWLPRMMAGVVVVGSLVGSGTVGWAIRPEVQETEEAEKSEEATEEKQDEAKQTEQEDGTADFEKATELKLNARRPMDLDKVVQLCESALKKGLDPATEEFCRRLMLDSLMEYARISSSRVLTPQPDPRWRFLRGEALKRLTKVVDIEAKNVEALMLIAKLNLLETGDREQGAEAVAKVIELSADNKAQMAEALLVRAGYADDEEQRLKDFNQAVELDPKNIAILRARAIYFMQQANNEKALLDFQAVLEAEPNIENRLLLATVMMKAEQLDKALELLAAAEPAEGEVRPKLMMAQIYFNKKEYEKCIENADQVLEMVRDLPEATNIRIMSLLQLDRNEDALAATEELVEKMPNNPNGYWLRSLANSSMDKYDEAIQDLQFLVESVPDASVFKLQLGNLYNASDRPRAALQVFEELLEENPDLEGLYRSRGDAYLGTGQHAEAIADYEKELAKNPEDSGTLNNLAWALATAPDDSVRNGARSLELGLKACELTKYEQAHILSTLASGYAETGDFEKAREWIAKAVTLAETKDAKNLEHLKKEAASYEKNEAWRETEIKEEAPMPESAPKRRPRQRPPIEDSEDDF